MGSLYNYPARERLGGGVVKDVDDERFDGETLQQLITLNRPLIWLKKDDDGGFYAVDAWLMFS